MIKLIRYANEGFKGYDYYEDTEFTPKFVNEKDRKIEPWVRGCYVFIEEVDESALLMYKKDRSKEKRNELYVPDDTLIWAYNKTPKINQDGTVDKWLSEYYRDLNGLLSWQSWIKLTAIEIAERVRFVKKHFGKVSYIYSEGIFECQ